jgi:hypothetical protein
MSRRVTEKTVVERAIFSADSEKQALALDLLDCLKDLEDAKEVMEAAIKDADYYRKEANSKADDLLRCHGFKEEAEAALDACRERLEIHLGCETTTTKTLKNLMIRAEDLGSKPWRDTRAVILARSVLYGKEGGGA